MAKTVARQLRELYFGHSRQQSRGKQVGQELHSRRDRLVSSLYSRHQDASTVSRFLYMDKCAIIWLCEQQPDILQPAPANSRQPSSSIRDTRWLACQPAVQLAGYLSLFRPVQCVRMAKFRSNLQGSSSSFCLSSYQPILSHHPSSFITALSYLTITLSSFDFCAPACWCNQSGLQQQKLLKLDLGLASGCCHLISLVEV